MKYFYFLFLLVFFCIAFIVTKYGESIHEKIVKSCERTGGSYLGGHCVHLYFDHK